MVLGPAMSVAGPEDVVRGCARSPGRLRNAPADIAVVNGVLQILHSTGQLMSGINGSFEEGTGSR
jgi:hypothetical protein